MGILMRIMVLTEDGKEVCYKENLDSDVIDDAIGDFACDVESTYPNCSTYWLEPMGIVDSIGFVDNSWDDEPSDEEELYDLLGDID